MQNFRSDYFKRTVWGLSAIMMLMSVGLSAGFCKLPQTSNSVAGQILGNEPVMLTLDGAQLESLFQGVPVSPALTEDPSKVVGGCYAGYFPEWMDYDCYGGLDCPWVALCRFEYYPGCRPYYLPFYICHGCATDQDCWPG